MSDENRYNLLDEKGKYYLRKLDSLSSSYSKGMDYVIEYEGKEYYAGGSKEKYIERQKSGGARKDATWLWSKSKFEQGVKDGEIIKSVEMVNTGDKVTTIFRDGSVTSRVEDRKIKQ